MILKGKQKGFKVLISDFKAVFLSRRELNPGLERIGTRGGMTSSHTDHYTTEDLQVWTPVVDG